MDHTKIQHRMLESEKHTSWLGRDLVEEGPREAKQRRTPVDERLGSWEGTSLIQSVQESVPPFGKKSRRLWCHPVWVLSEIPTLRSVLCAISFWLAAAPQL